MGLFESSHRNSDQQEFTEFTDKWILCSQSETTFSVRFLIQFTICRLQLFKQVIKKHLRRTQFPRLKVINSVLHPDKTVAIDLVEWRIWCNRRLCFPEGRVEFCAKSWTGISTKLLTSLCRHEIFLENFCYAVPLSIKIHHNLDRSSLKVLVQKQTNHKM